MPAERDGSQRKRQEDDMKCDEMGVELKHSGVTAGLLVLLFSKHVLL